MEKDAVIFIAGHNGMVGSALLRRLRAAGYRNLVTRGRAELDLTDQGAVHRFFADEGIDVVLLAAARVGGILANALRPVNFLYENLVIETNVIHAAHQAGVGRLVFFGSSCIYPRDCPQPIREESLLSGPLERTNEAYAIAKIAGLKLCEAYNRQYGTRYVSLMPTNLYGPNDNFHPENSHVVPAMLRRFHEAVQANAEEVVVWGTGTPMREFLHVDDMAEASLFVLDLDPGRYAANTQPMLSHINVGTGSDVTIRELAETIAEVTGFKGRLVFDTSKPDGTPRKLMDVSRLTGLGWTARTTLKDGIALAYQDFLSKQG